jgi:hypothetical protein
VPLFDLHPLEIEYGRIVPEAVVIDRVVIDITDIDSTSRRRSSWWLYTDHTLFVPAKVGDYFTYLHRLTRLFVYQDQIAHLILLDECEPNAEDVVTTPLMNIRLNHHTTTALASSNQVQHLGEICHNYTSPF